MDEFVTRLNQIKDSLRRLGSNGLTEDDRAWLIENVAQIDAYSKKQYYAVFDRVPQPVRKVVNELTKPDGACLCLLEGFKLVQIDRIQWCLQAGIDPRDDIFSMRG